MQRTKSTTTPKEDNGKKEKALSKPLFQRIKWLRLGSALLILISISLFPVILSHHPTEHHEVYSRSIVNDHLGGYAPERSMKFAAEGVAHDGSFAFGASTKSTATNMYGMPEDRMIKRSTTLNLKLNEGQSLSDEKIRLEDLIKANGGYLFNSALTFNSYTRIEARIPSQNLDVFVRTATQLEGRGMVTYQSLEEDDVTDEFVDVTARIKNSESVHAQYLQLLKKAQAVHEILEVQRELSRITEQMEVQKARQERLSKDVKMAKVTITIEQSLTHPPQPPVTISKEWIIKQFQRSYENLILLTMNIIEILIWILVNSPVVATVGAVMFYLGKKLFTTKAISGFFVDV